MSEIYEDLDFPEIEEQRKGLERKLKEAKAKAFNDHMQVVMFKARHAGKKRADMVIQPTAEGAQRVGFGDRLEALEELAEGSRREVKALRDVLDTFPEPVKDEEEL